MKALSVRQPYANQIARGIKTLEIRSWSTPYRGPLVICATARPDIGFRAHHSELGCFICVVDLVKVIPWTQALTREAYCSPGDWFPDMMGWVLENPRQLHHTHIKGRLGLFEIPDTDLVYG